MAADILLYQADLVPVGEDQKQHLELTRDLAIRVNDKFGGDRATPLLKLPESLIRKEGARVMSLTDGTSKMSKSDPSEMSRIHLLDDADAITKKIKRCKTDAMRGLEFDNPERPECHNLLSLYTILSGKTKETVQEECSDMRGWGDFKPLLTETVILSLQPIQTKYQEVVNEPGYLEQVLKEGREKAGAIAFDTLKQVKSALGFLLP
jgi:tryptophanyl-tRNA synthetase